MIWFGGLVLTVIGFVVGRVFSQSEAILADKRRIYEAFLRECLRPNETYARWSPETEARRFDDFARAQAPLLLYGSPAVAFALDRYLKVFQEARSSIGDDDPLLHPAFRETAKAQNDLILEMRRDAFAWSAFAYTGKTRFPLKSDYVAGRGVS